MSTTEAQHEEHVTEEHGHAHPSDAQYIGIAAILAMLTAIEVGTYYIDTFKDHFALLIVTLIPLMVVKFGLVAAFFMHLRFDNKLFRRVFLTGIILAVVVYMVVLTTFHVFLHANR
jgi:cytochrome c oxidase subunit IV